MKARTHDLAAVTALGVIVMAQPENHLTLGTAVAALLANQLGGIAPGIDQPVAPLWRNLPIGGFFGRQALFSLGVTTNLQIIQCIYNKSYICYSLICYPIRAASSAG